MLKLIPQIWQLVAKASPRIRAALRFIEAIEKATRETSSGGKTITVDELVKAVRDSGIAVKE